MVLKHRPRVLATNVELCPEAAVTMTPTKTPARKPRTKKLLAATCFAVTPILSLLPSATSATAVSTAAGNTAVAGTIAGPGTQASFGLSTLGRSGWEVDSSANATQTGAAISTPGFSTSSWLNVKPDDAGAPGTEIEALLQSGACPNVFYSDNMRSCFGYESNVGPDTVPQFDVPWWYRTDFRPDLQAGQNATVVINGIVGQADVWVNGTEIATQATVEGDFTKFTFDVTSLLRHGVNSIALEVYPNDPTTMFTLDNVDWSQIPPDNNTGIQFPIQLQVSDALALSNSHILQTTATDLSSSALTVKADVINNTAAAQTGTVTAVISPPKGSNANSIVVVQQVTVPASTTGTVTFTPADYPSLTIKKPQIWWPYQMGSQPLYALDTALTENSRLINTSNEEFGIRTVTTSLVGPSTLAPGGVRQFSVNGQPIVIRGGGYDENLFLHYDAQDIANQITLMKSMGLNAIRLEGHEMPDNFYQQMDAAGIVIDGGYQCCDEWQLHGHLTPTPQQLNTVYLSALTIGTQLRNHPSVINFSWSDNNPTIPQEQVSLQGFSDADFQDPLIASAEYKSGTILPLSGEKEGPYDWVPPSYWYDTKHSDYNDDSSLTNVGGSWGFDSEESGGNTVPTLDSIQRFMSPQEQTELWTNPSYNQYHANYEPDVGGYSFGTLFNFDAALKSRYGTWTSLAQYVEEAQEQNYENTRSQFEAFIDHSTNTSAPSTGTIYWQANKGWPSLLWNLYNSDYDEAGSYFGAKKADEGVHALFATDNNTVTIDNLTGSTASGLSVESKVYTTSGTLLDDQTVNGLRLTSQQVKNAVIKPKVPATTKPPAIATTYFVELLLRQNGQIIDRNVYWQSTQKDIVNWAQTEGNPQATMTQYGDLTALQSLAPATITAVANTALSGKNAVTTVTITNTSTSSTVGFFLRADVRRGTSGGTAQLGDNEVLPITWSDNDITLWPGESQTLTASYATANLKGATPVVSVNGSNVTNFDVPALRNH